MLSGLENTRSDPEEIVTRALQRALSPAYPPGHAHYVLTLDEAIEPVKATILGDAKKFYRDFYGLGGAEMAVVGDFDPNEVTPLVKELVANWRRPATYKRIPSLYKPVVGRAESFNTPNKENAVVPAATNLGLRDDDPAYPALVLGNYMLGAGS